MLRLHPWLLLFRSGRLYLWRPYFLWLLLYRSDHLLRFRLLPLSFQLLPSGRLYLWRPYFR